MTESPLTLTQVGPAAETSSAEPRLTPGGSVDLAIRVDRVSRAFGSISALESLSFEVPRGTVFGFLGPNGAGKTTTIRLLLGLVEPDSGHADVLGLDPRFEGSKIRDRSGALLSDPGLYDRLTAEDNLDFYARVWHLSPGDRRARIEQELTRFGLWDRRHESPEPWSTGMRRKLAIARALLHRPELVFLDEPTSGLDLLAAHELGDSLVRLAATDGVTVFLTTHDLAEAERLCHDVAIIRAGRVLAAGTPAEIRARVGGRAVVIGRGFDDTVLRLIRQQPQVQSVELDGERLSLRVKEGTSLAPLVTLMAGAGAQIEEVHPSSLSLEDAFAALLKEGA